MTSAWRSPIRPNLTEWGWRKTVRTTGLYCRRRRVGSVCPSLSVSVLSGRDGEPERERGPRLRESLSVRGKREREG
jgi:hypothetical protein